MSQIFLVISLVVLSNHVYSKVLEKDTLNPRQVEFIKRIMPTNTKIGQIGGIDTDEDRNLLVFHRGQRKWAFDSFYPNNQFNTLRYGPIEENVLSLLNPENMKEVESWGANKFYMPHGLTIDFDNNIWLTDVALHQVFKYNFKISDEPLLTLGTRFKKGNDEFHFCKPTKVAVSQLNGNIFVADGYCNKRVVEFDSHGEFVQEFTDNDQPMIVVHSIALIESEGLVCAASREDGRIVCFDIPTGDKRFVIEHKDMKTVYAIVYDPMNELLHVVTGDNHNSESTGLTFDMSPINFGALHNKWSDKDVDMSEAHDIALSLNAKQIYIGQLNGEIDQFENKHIQA